MVKVPCGVLLVDSLALPIPLLPTRASTGPITTDQLPSLACCQARSVAVVALALLAVTVTTCFAFPTDTGMVKSGAALLGAVRVLDAGVLGGNGFDVVEGDPDVLDGGAVEAGWLDGDVGAGGDEASSPPGGDADVVIGGGVSASSAAVDSRESAAVPLEEVGVPRGVASSDCAAVAGADEARCGTVTRAAVECVIPGPLLGVTRGESEGLSAAVTDSCWTARAELLAIQTTAVTPPAATTATAVTATSWRSADFIYAPSLSVLNGLTAGVLLAAMCPARPRPPCPP